MPIFEKEEIDISWLFLVICLVVDSLNQLGCLYFNIYFDT